MKSVATYRMSSLRIMCSAIFLAFSLLAHFPATAQTIGIDSGTATEETQPQADATTAPAEAPDGAVSGMGDINLYPRRIVIDQRQRIATVGLYNKIAAPGEYEISIRDMVMTSEGGLFPVGNLPEGVSAERLQPAGEMLRWSPRRVRLLGNEAQTVRVMARPPADLPDGEYRSHFMVVSTPPGVDDGFSIENATGNADGTGIGVRIRPRFALSIPVIMRVGETTLDVGLEGMGLTEADEGTAISMTITRSGTRSAYGDVLVTMPGSAEPVAIARGVGVYPEIDSRTLSLQLNSEFDASLLQRGSILTVQFVDDDFVPGNILASRDFVVP